jgi:hypothetical protein
MNRAFLRIAVVLDSLITEARSGHKLPIPGCVRLPVDAVPHAGVAVVVVELAGLWLEEGVEVREA